MPRLQIQRIFCKNSATRAQNKTNSFVFTPQPRQTERPLFYKNSILHNETEKQITKTKKIILNSAKKIVTLQFEAETAPLRLVTDKTEYDKNR